MFINIMIKISTLTICTFLVDFLFSFLKTLIEEKTSNGGYMKLTVDDVLNWLKISLKST